MCPWAYLGHFLNFRLKNLRQNFSPVLHRPTIPISIRVPAWFLHACVLTRIQAYPGVLQKALGTKLIPSLQFLVSCIVVISFPPICNFLKGGRQALPLPTGIFPVVCWRGEFPQYTSVGIMPLVFKDAPCVSFALQVLSLAMKIE